MWGWNSDTSSTRPQSPFPQGRPALELENVRDYAAVYLDGVFQGALTDNRKTLTLKAEPGRHTCSSMSKTSAASPTARRFSTTRKDSSAKPASAAKRSPAGRSPRSKCATPIPKPSSSKPSARATRPVSGAGSSTVRRTKEPVYLDVSGWGMGEVWINGHYLGSFWDEEKQQSILIPAEILAEKGNRIVVFDLKNNDPGATMRLSDKPVFK